MYRKPVCTFLAIRFVLAVLLVTVLLAGCKGDTPPTATGVVETQTPSLPAETDTPVPTLTPSATPEPLALTVNGVGVSLAAFEIDMHLLQEADQALGNMATIEDQHQQVVDHWVNTLLLEQAAAAGGYMVDEAALQVEVDRLAGWMSEHGYSEASFREVLRAQMAAAWQRDQIAASVPATTEQIHARQIMTLDEESANRAMEQVKTPGVNFAAQAFRYDLATGGDLGWFPRGYLTQPEVEEAAFALQPGEVSPIIHSSIGYHIIQVIAREPARVLSPDARRALQKAAIENWLKEMRATAKVDVLLLIN